MSKKKISLMFLTCMFMLSSCSAGNNFNDALEGEVYDHYKEISFNDETYSIYVPNSEFSPFVYSYYQSTHRSTSYTWTVNFYKDVKYIFTNNYQEDMLNNIYEMLLSETQQLSELYNCPITFYKPNEKILVEKTLTNVNQEEISYYVLEKFLPVRVHNNNTRQSFTAGALVEIDVLLSYKDMIENPFTHEMILLSELPNVLR